MGLILILIFAEALALYGLIVSLILSQSWVSVKMNVKKKIIIQDIYNWYFV